MEQEITPIIERVRQVSGGPSGLAAKLNERHPHRPITSQAISQWKRVPIDRVGDVSAVTGIPRHELRPEIFGAA